MNDRSQSANTPMTEASLAYLKLHEAMAKTNSPNDQPALQGLDSLFELLSALPPDGDLSQIREDLYRRIISLAKGELQRQ
jgi:hypothetical protein